MPLERSVSEDCGSEKDHNKKNTEGKTNGLSSRDLELLVLLGVSPVLNLETFTLQHDLSCFVVGTVDNVVNERTVARLQVDFLLGHVHGHLVVVGHVLVALSTLFEKSCAHGDDTLISGGWALDIGSVHVVVASFVGVLFLFVFLLRIRKRRVSRDVVKVEIDKRESIKCGLPFRRKKCTPWGC